MSPAVLLLAALLAGQADAANVVCRSAASGVRATSTSTETPPTIPTDPPPPAEFTLSYARLTSVTAGNAVDLRSTVAGASRTVTYLVAGTLPAGVTFQSKTGAFSGRAFAAGV